ncbi:MAG: hypothetical protein GXO25_00575 [Euryarchaeota archaeon]|nr:hypothetical protein [Euryarchaeota archaeon]
MGSDELRGGVCDACRNMKELSKKSIPKEIFIKYPYAKRGKEWFISRGKNAAYITKIKNMTLSYRVVDGKIVEHRS